MAFTLKPLYGRVVFAYEHRIDRKLKAGPLVLERSRPEFEGIPEKGLVVAIADDVKNIEVGKRYCFSDPSPVGVTWEGQKYLFIDQKNVMAEEIDG